MSSRASRTDDGSRTTSPTSRSVPSRAATARSSARSSRASGSATATPIAPRTTSSATGWTRTRTTRSSRASRTSRGRIRATSTRDTSRGRGGGSVRRRTTLLVGGAVAVALALGGLVGGVLAESRSASASTAAPVALADRALAGAAGGVGAPALASLEKRVQARAARCWTSHAARIRVPAPLARDGRSFVSPALRGGASPGGARRGRGCRRHARARLARSHPARVPGGSSPRAGRAEASSRVVAALRRDRRRADRARTLRRGLRRVRAHGDAPPEPRVVRTDRLRTRARRRPRGCASRR